MTWGGKYWGGEADPSLASPSLLFFQITGLVADYLWVGDSTTDRVKGEVLTAQGVVEINEPAPGTNVSSLSAGAFQFTAATADALDAANAAVADYPGTFGAWIIYRAAVLPAATQAMMGKRESAGAAAGWELTINALGQVGTTIDVGASQVSLTMTDNTADNKWRCAGLVVDRDSDILRLATESETSMTVAAPAGSLSSTAVFSIGQGRLQAAGIKVLAVALVNNLDADTDPADVCGTLAQSVFQRPDYSWIPD